MVGHYQPNWNMLRQTPVLFGRCPMFDRYFNPWVMAGTPSIQGPKLPNIHTHTMHTAHTHTHTHTHAHILHYTHTLHTCTHFTHTHYTHAHTHYTRTQTQTHTTHTSHIHTTHAHRHIHTLRTLHTHTHTIHIHTTHTHTHTHTLYTHTLHTHTHRHTLRTLHTYTLHTHYTYGQITLFKTNIDGMCSFCFSAAIICGSTVSLVRWLLASTTVITTTCHITTVARGCVTNQYQTPYMSNEHQSSLPCSAST